MGALSKSVDLSFPGLHPLRSWITTLLRWGPADLRQLMGGMAFDLSEKNIKKKKVYFFIFLSLFLKIGL